ncbi:hypothetical protein ABPG74_018037 [Tetrahymena malaccensis]
MNLNPNQIAHQTLEELDQSYYDKLYGKQFFQNEQLKSEVKKISPANFQDLKTMMKSNKWQKLQRYIIINPFSGKKSIWDVFVILMVFYSCYTSYLWASFWPQGFEQYYYIEIMIEIFFLVDMIVNFLTSYLINYETKEITYSVVDTSLNYIKKGFIFDALAIFPFNLIFPQANLKLLQMIRILRFFRMTDENAICEKLNILIDNINPRDKVKVQYTSRYIYRIFRFILIGFSIAFFLACAWYIYCTSIWSNYEFENQYFQHTNVLKKVILCYYFILSTLATVGYGDLVPITTQDRIIAIIIMICGVGFFSYIINNFNDIMKNYKTKLGYVDKTPELEDWLLSLNKVSEESMDERLVKKIYDHFNYLYKNYRLVTLTKEDKYYQLMTDSERRQMIRHLFQDIFSGLFRTFFLKEGKTEFSDYNFYIDIAFALQPRKCQEKELILEQGENVEEMYFLIDGEIEASFMVDDIKIQKYFSSGFQFGCVQILSSSVSNFTYQATSPATLYVIKKDAFLKIFNKYIDVRQDIVLNAFSTFKFTRRAMMEAFAQQIQQKLNIKLSVQQSNYLFDIVNKKFQKAKKNIIKKNLTAFTKPLKITFNEMSDSDSDSENDISFNERMNNLQNNINELNEIISQVHPTQVQKQSSKSKSIFQKINIKK